MPLLSLTGLLVGYLSLANASPLAKRAAYPPTAECTGTCQGRLHDPSVIYQEDTKTYYRFTTNDKITVATAPAMSGPWTPQGAALPNGSIIDLPGNQDLWAPDVFQLGDTFYMYYAVSSIGSNTQSDIGVATSTALHAGSWTDHGSIGIPARNDEWNRIDPNIFRHDDASAPLLSWGSFWANIFQVEMADPPLKIAGDAVHLAQNTTTRPAPLAGGAQEGAYQFQWNGYYYLFLSAGNCCDTPPSAENPDNKLPPAGEEYHTMVCRSTQASGGFVDDQGRDCLNGNGGTMVLESHGDGVYAPGGGGVFYDPNLGTPVFYYHYVNPSVSYDYDDFFFGWNKLDFSSGWPVVVA